jgi:hypothetical protein
MITGRIVDLEGRTVAGATVRIMYYATPRTGDLTPWLDAVRSDRPALFTRQHRNDSEVSATALMKVTTEVLYKQFERPRMTAASHVLTIARVDLAGLGLRFPLS